MFWPLKSWLQLAGIPPSTKDGPLTMHRAVGRWQQELLVEENVRLLFKVSNSTPMAQEHQST